MAGKPGKPLQERFWQYVVKGDGDACWDWRASVGSHGYPQLAFKNSKVTGHTLSWAIHFGPVPDGLCVLHRCDNRRCTNPVHLFLGTKAENLKDMREKGRAAAGEKHGMHKLTEDNVKEILSLTGTHQSISEKFGVHRATVTQIKTRAYWKHIEGANHDL